jgi:hypothetical protein
LASGDDGHDVPAAATPGADKHIDGEQLAAVVVAVSEYREAIEDFFASIPAAQWVRTLPIGDHGITAPSLWARLGDAPERWESFRHLQAQAGAVPIRSTRQGLLERLSAASGPFGTPIRSARQVLDPSALVR